ncbi:MAG TPA: hypothetical protein VFE62_06510 [Gemmataceae bacterium]|nr:hypothetical protein [Gemmataceae bacterium]
MQISLTVAMFLLFLLAGQPIFNGINPKAAFPSCTLDVKTDPTHPVGMPIILSIQLTNKGKTPVSYWCGGPRDYPGLGGLQATVTPEGGKPTVATLSNGQYFLGSGMDRQIKPGQAMEVPGVMPPLPKGSYTIQIGEGKSVQVKVADDPDLLKKREADLLAGVRKGDPFLQHAATLCRLPSFQKSILKDLDGNFVVQASDVLVRVGKDLPPDAGKYVGKALRRSASNSKELWTLASLASRIGTDEMLDIVQGMARSEGFGREGRLVMIRHLSLFKQEKSRTALRDLLKDGDEFVRFRAAYDLAVFKGADRAGLDVLIAVAENPNHKERVHACFALAWFTAEPRAERAIRSRLTDADGNVRQSAASALQQLLQKRKSR